MNYMKILAAALMAIVLLLGAPTTAAAAGPIDDNPPNTIKLEDFVEENLASALQNSNRPQEGPAPCLIVGNIENFPEVIQLERSLK